MNHDPGFSTPVTAAIAAEIVVIFAIFITAAIFTNTINIFGVLQ